MHILIAILLLLIIWYRGIWQDWKQYHATMLFFGVMELIYNSIVKENNYFLWKIVPELLPSRIPLIIFYAFFIFPASALLFLSKLPEKISKQAVYVVKWVGMYTFVEGIGSILGRIEYFNGWSIWHSLIFNAVLFSGLILHYKKPLAAYVLFIIVTMIGIWVYNIPI